MTTDDFEPAPEPAPPEPPEALSRAIVRPVLSEKQGGIFDKGRAQKEPPHSPEAEEHVLALCMSDGPQRATAHGITAQDFYSPQNRIVFSTILDLGACDTATLGEELKTRRELEAVGGYTRLMAIENLALGGMTHAGYMIEKVRTCALLRATIKAATQTVEEAYGFTGGLDEFLAQAEDRLTRIRTGAAPAQARPTRPITSYAYPSDDDPNMLLGSDDYLGRGGGLLFVSHAGAGKSSWAYDACMMWSLGRVWQGIKSHQPRKVLIVQAEDSDRYIGKIFTSFAHVNKLTPEETELLGKYCVIVRLKGVSGPAFFTTLTALTQEHQPDLVVINPIYLYAEGDITRSEFAQPFLLGLDRVNREEKWAYILIHHTGKPAAKGTNGKRPELEDWESAYMGFGSSYLANWPRATILLEPVPGNPGHFQIKLGKGGYNAGVTQPNEFGMGATVPSTRIAIRHSTERMQVNGKDRPVFYWEIDDAPPPAEAQDNSRPKRGRPEVYPFSTFRSIFPLHTEEPLKLSELTRRAIQNKPITDKQLYNVLERYVDGGLIECIEVQGQPKKYRMAL